MCKPATYAKSLTRYQNQDPTRTLSLRRRYAREMRKRFRHLRGVIRDGIVNKDIFGIAGGHQGLQGNVFVLETYQSNLRPQAFDFPRVQDKVNEFMEWLEQQVDRDILEVSDRRRIGQSIDQTWQNVFIEDSYKRGVQRSAYELGALEFPNFSTIAERGGLQAVMSGPIHADRLGVLYTRAYNELKGITDTMGTQVSRVLTQGLADGDGPRTIARKLNATIGGRGATPGQLGITDTLGRFIPAQRRAEILARTEVIRAHHSGMMQEYRNWRVEGIQVKAEFRTAGDTRVCPECEALEGTFYTLDQAEGLIPVHPQCRCIALPARPEDVPEGARVVGEEQEFDYDSQATQFNEKLAEEQRQALSDYVQYDTSAANFEDINGELRRLEGLSGLVPDDQVRRKIQRIDAAIDAANPLENSINVYRGLDQAGFRSIFPNGASAGDTLQDFGFTSTTLRRESAEGFTLGKGWVFEVRVPAGKKVGLPRHPEFDEMEVLLPRGSRRNNNFLQIQEVDEENKVIKAVWNADQ